MNNKKGKGVTGILLAENISKAVFVSLLLLATTFVASASAQPCDHEVEVLGVCCDAGKTYTTQGWFYNETTGWDYSTDDSTVLFHLKVDGEEYDAYCINYEVPLMPNNKFKASIYPAEPTCKNNSIAYILNKWTHDCAHCEVVSAGQSAVWYLWYINDIFCSEVGEPKYNHTAEPGDPGWESRWIINCTAHPEACDMVNTSINKSVPYKIETTPSSGSSFPEGTPIELETTVSYCLGAVGAEVTVVFEADNTSCKFENDASEYENTTVNGKAKATLTCAPGVDSVHVTARVKDMKWFEIVEPCNGYQETLKIIDITDDVKFSFVPPTPTPRITPTPTPTPRITPTPTPPAVPTLTPIGLIVLVGLLSIIAAVSISIGIRKKR